MSANDKDDDTATIFSDRISPDKKHYDFHFALPSPALPSSPQQPMDVDTSGPIRLPEEQDHHLHHKTTSEKKQKLNNGKVRLKIRKLVNESDSSCCDDSPGKFRKWFRLRTLAVCSFGLLVAVLMGVATKEDLRQDFFRRYKRQYHLLLYGVEDYCSQDFDFSNVTAALEAQIIGQAEAIERITEIFNTRQNEPFTSLALLGTTGVGKTLMATVIAHNFQWRSNVHRFFWDVTATPEKQFANFQSFLHSIRHGTVVEASCGHNLLVIDHLGSADTELINKIDNRLRFVAEKDHIQLTVLYVFQGSRSVNPSGWENLLNPFIERIWLRRLKEYDLLQCVRLEAKELGLSLDDNPRLVKDLMTSMDVWKYGCKAVRAKVSFYSQF